jgi:hypothetical protein
MLEKWLSDFFTIVRKFLPEGKDGRADLTETAEL